MNQPTLDLLLMEQIKIYRQDLPPTEALEQMAPRPSNALVDDIAQHWIREPILVVDDPSGHKGVFSMRRAGNMIFALNWRYYPVAGHRRTLAIDHLIQSNWIGADGATAADTPIPAVLLHGLTIAQGLKVVRAQEALRSANKNVETWAINNEAERLGISINQEGAAREIARSLGMPRQVAQVQRSIDELNLGMDVMEGYLNGQVAGTVLKEILSLHNKEAIQEIGQRVAIA